MKIAKRVNNKKVHVLRIMRKSEKSKNSKNKYYCTTVRKWGREKRVKMAATVTLFSRSLQSPATASVAPSPSARLPVLGRVRAVATGGAPGSVRTRPTAAAGTARPRRTRAALLLRRSVASGVLPLLAATWSGKNYLFILAKNSKIIRPKKLKKLNINK